MSCVLGCTQRACVSVWSSSLPSLWTEGPAVSYLQTADSIEDQDILGAGTGCYGMPGSVYSGETVCRSSSLAVCYWGMVLDCMVLALLVVQ